MWCYYLIIIQVYHLEPIKNTSDRSFIFLTQHEPYEILVVHFVFCCTFELSRNLLKYSIHCLTRESMPFITRKVFFINQKVVVRVQLPKSAIKDIKVLIREILSHNIDIIFVTHLKKCVHKVWLLKISPCYFPIIVWIQHKENSHYYCICIPILKFWSRLQKF